MAAWPTKKGKSTDSTAIIDQCSADANRTLTLNEEDHSGPRKILENVNRNAKLLRAKEPNSKVLFDNNRPYMQNVQERVNSKSSPPQVEKVTLAFRTGHPKAPASTPTSLSECRQVVESYAAELAAKLAAAQQRACKTEEKLYSLAQSYVRELEALITSVEQQGSSLPRAADAADIDALIVQRIEELRQCYHYMMTTLNEHSPIENGFNKVVETVAAIYAAGRSSRSSATSSGIVQATLSRGVVGKREAELVADSLAAEPAAATESQALLSDVGKHDSLIAKWNNNQGECQHPSPSMFGEAVAEASSPQATAQEGAPPPSGSESTGTPPSPTPSAAVTMEPVCRRTLCEITASVQDQMKEAQTSHDSYINLSDETVDQFTKQVSPLVGQLVLSRKNEAAFNAYAQAMYNSCEPVYYESFAGTAARERSSQASLVDQIENQVKIVYDDTICTLGTHVDFYMGQLAVGNRLLALLDFMEHGFGIDFVNKIGEVLKEARSAKLQLAIESALKVCELFRESIYYTKYITLLLKGRIAQSDVLIEEYTLEFHTALPGAEQEDFQVKITKEQATKTSAQSQLALRCGLTAPDMFLEANLLPKDAVAVDRLITLIQMRLDESGRPAEPGLSLVPAPTVNGCVLMDPIAVALADYESITKKQADHRATHAKGGSSSEELKLLKCESG